MSDEDDIFKQLEGDEGIKAASQELEAACKNDSDPNCVVCQTRKGLDALMFVSMILEGDHECESESCKTDPITELDVAMVLVDDLDSALGLLDVCQKAIRALTLISTAAVYIVAENELDLDGDDDGDDG